MEEFFFNLLVGAPEFALEGAEVHPEHIESGHASSYPTDKPEEGVRGKSAAEDFVFRPEPGQREDARQGQRPDRGEIILVVLIVGRVVQAIGAGAMVPITMAMVGDLFPPGQRAKPLGIVATVDTAGWVLGNPHSPGYPAYTQLARGIQLLPLGDAAVGHSLPRRLRDRRRHDRHHGAHVRRDLVVRQLPGSLRRRRPARRRRRHARGWPPTPPPPRP